MKTRQSKELRLKEIQLANPNYDVEAVVGNCEVDLKKLADNQKVCWGDGETYYILMTERQSNPSRLTT